MSTLPRITVPAHHRSHQEMLNDHRKVLQNYFDTFITRGLSRKTLDSACGFIERWFEKIRVSDTTGERQIFIWEVMNLGEGRQRIKEFLMTLSALGEDNHVCLRPQTARAYAGHLERLFIKTLEFPFIEGQQTIQSKYGPIENPFTGVEYPIHSRDRLRAEKFFLTPEEGSGASLCEVLRRDKRPAFPGADRRCVGRPLDRHAD